MKSSESLKLPSFLKIGLLTLALYLVSCGPPAKLDPDNTFLIYYSPSTDLIKLFETRLSNSPDPTLPKVKDYIQCLRYFGRGQWEEARQAIDTFKSETPLAGQDYQVLLFFKAKSTLNLGEYEKASKLYDQFLSGPKIESGIMNLAEYERALLWLKIDPAKSKEYLLAIANQPDHIYNEAATQFANNL